MKVMNELMDRLREIYSPANAVVFYDSEDGYEAMIRFGQLHTSTVYIEPKECRGFSDDEIVSLLREKFDKVVLPKYRSEVRLSRTKKRGLA